MRKNIAAVIEAFKASKPCKGETCSTDGNIIYSYQLPIAHRVGTGGVLIIPVSNGESKTTRGHIRACWEAFPSIDKMLSQA